MTHEDWLARWREGRTGWHQSEVTPLLRQHWAALQLPAKTRVLVPLCGKTLDLRWLADRGLDVLGVELSALAVQQFFAEHGLAPVRRAGPHGVHYSAGRIEIIVADILDVDAQALSGCTAVYDRAALIALPPVQRRRYARAVYGALPPGTRGLLIALEYAQERMDGPPFAVHEPEVRQLLEPDWDVALALRRGTTGPGKAGPGVAFSAAAYTLERR